LPPGDVEFFHVEQVCIVDPIPPSTCAAHDIKISMPLILLALPRSEVLSQKLKRPLLGLMFERAG
jgi:hypothetical protein